MRHGPRSARQIQGGFARGTKSGKGRAIMKMTDDPRFWERRRKVLNAPRASSESRVALVAFERGISAKELERFYYVNRKGSKTRYFDHHAFAEKYGVDIHWI